MSSASIRADVLGAPDRVEINLAHLHAKLCISLRGFLTRAVRAQEAPGDGQNRHHHDRPTSARHVQTGNHGESSAYVIEMVAPGTRDPPPRGSPGPHRETRGGDGPCRREPPRVGR